VLVPRAVELKDIVPDRFRRILDDNRALHLRIQAELWESRPVWDRLVYPAIIRVFRLTRSAPPVDPMPLEVELGAMNRIDTAARYYVHVNATIGTLAEREADEVGDAVFGKSSEANGLGSLGRLMMRTAIQVNDYLQSVSAELKSRRMSGIELTRP
jgi:hypothetical protein